VDPSWDHPHNHSCYLQNGPTGGAPPRNDSTSQLQSAADVGKKAWMPGTTSAAGDAAVGHFLLKTFRRGLACLPSCLCGHMSDARCFHSGMQPPYVIPISLTITHQCLCIAVCQALKSVKGVLNKLTPEKFDRLLGQLVAAVTSVDVLNGLIRLVFDNAVRSYDCPDFAPSVMSILCASGAFTGMTCMPDLVTVLLEAVCLPMFPTDRAADVRGDVCGAVRGAGATAAGAGAAQGRDQTHVLPAPAAEPLPGPVRGHPGAPQGAHMACWVWGAKILWHA
jgi:hypothetical protein